MFQEKGEIIIEKEDQDEDEMMMTALDAGAEDFSSVREALEEQGVEFLEAAVKMIPDTYTAIDEEAAKKMQKMLDLLDDYDDVQEVYQNAEFPEVWEE